MTFQEELKKLTDVISVGIPMFGIDRVLRIVEEFALKKYKDEEKKQSPNLAEIAYWKEAREHVKTALSGLEDMHK
jgi:hypothetical protein